MAVIEAEKISKTFRLGEVDVHAVRDVDLRVDAGDYVALMGPSGSGKSTLMNILGCLDVPTSGTYRIEGKDVSSLSDNHLAGVRGKRIGFVFQSFQLISHLSVLENVEMPLFYARVPRIQRHERCRELIERVGLTDRAGHLPSQLSGGESQRASSTHLGNAGIRRQ